MSYFNNITVRRMDKEGPDELSALLDMLWEYTLDEDGNRRNGEKLDLGKLGRESDDFEYKDFGYLDVNGLLTLKHPRLSASIRKGYSEVKGDLDGFIHIDRVELHDGELGISAESEWAPFHRFVQKYFGCTFENLLFEYTYECEEDDRAGVLRFSGCSTVYDPAPGLGLRMRYWKYCFAKDYPGAMTQLRYRINEGQYAGDWDTNEERLDWFHNNANDPGDFMKPEDRDALVELLTNEGDLDPFFDRFRAK